VTTEDTTKYLASCPSNLPECKS